MKRTTGVALIAFWIVARDSVDIQRAASADDGNGRAYAERRAGANCMGKAASLNVAAFSKVVAYG
jgi:hypothetical protein